MFSRFPKVKFENHFFLFFTFLIFVIAGFTQFYALTAVPGFHFDEAWQGLYANRIATESGFWPLQAMNAYTSPVLHYLLAASFHFFGPTLQTMRMTLGLLNFLTFVGVFTLLVLRNEKTAALWFGLFWALLPLSVHNHRFYIEMTSFHGFCTAIILWAIHLFGSSLPHSRVRSISLLLGFFGIYLGCLSHVLFFNVFLTLLVMAIFFLQKKFPLKFFGAMSILLIPIFLNMGFELHKKAPLLIAIILGGMGTFALLFPGNAEKTLKKIQKVKRHSLTVLTVAAIPFSVFFIFLLWDGIWPYAQVTGELPQSWLPLNMILLFMGAIRAIRDRKIQQRSLERIVLIGAVLSLAFSSFMILKQSARYYMPTTILVMMWLAIVLSNSVSRHFQLLLGAIFVSWNLFAFQNYYIKPYQLHGGTNAEFKIGPFRDSSRDFRPFQKAFLWTQNQGCSHVIRWVQDDRFLRPIQFLQLTAPPDDKPCPWSRDDLLFSYLSPEITNSVKVVAHETDWGDLMFAERIQNGNKQK